MRNKYIDIVIVCVLALCLVCFPATAHDPSTHQHAAWYNNQTINPAARERLNVPYKSCCDAGDVFKTRFRVGSKGEDQWQYLKDGQWKVIPEDIIKEGDTPDRQPVLFINRHTGVELCFFVPQGGI